MFKVIKVINEDVSKFISACKCFQQTIKKRTIEYNDNNGNNETKTACIEFVKCEYNGNSTSSVKILVKMDQKTIMIFNYRFEEYNPYYEPLYHSVFNLNTIEELVGENLDLILKIGNFSAHELNNTEN